jgi:hypothetical protein
MAGEKGRGLDRHILAQRHKECRIPFSAGYAYSFSLVQIQIFLQLEGTRPANDVYINQELVENARNW